METTINPKTFCTDHLVSMQDCFYEHHKPPEEEKEAIVLPCRHVVEFVTGIIICGECGKKWLIQKTQREITAREQV